MTAFDDMMVDLFGDADLAVTARYYPADGRPPFDVQAVKRLPDAEIAVYGARVVQATTVLEVRAAELAAKSVTPAAGDVLTPVAGAGPTIAAPVKVQGKPERRDPLALVWTLDTVPYEPAP